MRAESSVVSDNPKSHSGLLCFRCRTPMYEVTRIAPLRDEPGLIAYVPLLQICYERVCLCGRQERRCALRSA